MTKHRMERAHSRAAVWVLTLGLLVPGTASAQAPQASARARVIVTTDGEIDDRCSMVRFLMYANEWDIEGIILRSSQVSRHRL